MCMEIKTAVALNEPESVLSMPRNILTNVQLIKKKLLTKILLRIVDVINNIMTSLVQG